MPAAVDPTKIVRFGIFELDLRARELRRRGVRVRLQEQSFQVLREFLAKPGEVITREELRQRLWAGHVYVDFDHGLNNVLARLRDVLGDSADKPRFIETLPKVGYRFIHPVENDFETGATPGPAATATESPAAATDPESRAEAVPGAPHTSWRQQVTARALALILLLAALAAAGGLWATRNGWQTVTTNPRVAGRSVAVVPFTNVTKDPDIEMLADGLSDELMSALAGIEGLHVPGRSSSFYFKGRTATDSAIATQLKVDNLLEGSIRKSGSRIRVTAQLIDAASGFQLWSQTFDREVSDMLTIEQDIAHSVASALRVRLLETDEARLQSHGTRDGEAYRLYLMARAKSAQSGAYQFGEARALYEQAAARDPSFAAAHAGIALMYGFQSRVESRDPVRSSQLGMEAAERALALNPNLADAYVARAFLAMARYQSNGDFPSLTRARADFRRALELNPANADARVSYAFTEMYIDPDFAQSMYERALEIDPQQHLAQLQIANIYRNRGQFDEARKRYLSLVELYPESSISYRQLALLEVFSGHLDRAIPWFQEMNRHGSPQPAVDSWLVRMSLGDRRGAASELRRPVVPELDRQMYAAASRCMTGRCTEALDLLERARSDGKLHGELDLTAAHLALAAGQTGRALKILLRRLPAVATGEESVNGYNVAGAIDLATTWQRMGNNEPAQQLLSKIAAYLDSTRAVHLPAAIYLRAEVFALAGDKEEALNALDRAFAAGFRTTWGTWLPPQSCVYLNHLSADPGMATLRDEPRFKAWLARIEEDNAHQLARLDQRLGNVGVDRTAGS